MRRADALSSERDRILEDGQRRAERIIAQAEEQAARLLRESEIIQLAQREAERIVTEAREQASSWDLMLGLRQATIGDAPKIS